MFQRLLSLRAASDDAMSWTTLVVTSRVWLLCAVLVVVLAMVHYRREQLPLIVFVVCAIVFTLLGARANPSFRYLLPAALAMVVLLASGAAPASGAEMPAAGSGRRSTFIAITALFALAMIKGIVNDVSAHRRRIESGLALHDAIVRAAPRDGIVIYSWRVPMPSFALRVMTNERRDHDEIATRWPREGHFNDWTREIVLPPGAKRWDYLVISPELLRVFPEPAGAPIARAGPYIVLESP